MHGSTQRQLEQLLAKSSQGEPGSGLSGAFLPVDGHVQQCAECALELQVMRQHAAILGCLRVPDEQEPAPGFYARVLQRIEERAKRSIWYGLVYTPIGLRIAYGSLSLALALGLYVVVVEHSELHDSALQAIVPPQSHAEVSASADPADQRDAVLVNLASYSSSDSITE